MTVLIFLVAIAAGVRGVWSPCGLSMLSTITPMGEQARGARYAWTAGWYVAGAVAGGTCLGAVLAIAARVSPTGRSIVLTVAALVAMASDTRLLGFQLPVHRRQVNERWLDRYRPWVYGAGFGWQVGTGFATYIVTAANYVLVVLAIASRSPAIALLAGTTFGLTRGIAVFLTRDASTPEALRRLHEGVHRQGARCRDAVVAVEAAVAVVAAARFSFVLAVPAAALAMGIWSATPARRRAPACELGGASVNEYARTGPPAS
jgi:uncharacterized membrane protein (UPF0136 family)